MEWVKQEMDQTQQHQKNMAKYQMMAVSYVLVVTVHILHSQHNKLTV